MLSRIPVLVLLLVAGLPLGGCALVRLPIFGEPAPEPRAEPPPPAPTRPADSLGVRLYDAAMAMRGRRIVVSLEDRWLWLLEGERLLLAAPVAVGRNDTFTYRDRTFRFETPRGRRKVLDKEENPIWVPPDWHYYEKAVDDGLEAVHLRKGQRVRLSDSTRIEVRGDQVGRVNRYGNWWPFTPGTEIIFDGKIFIPPLGTEQRRVPKTLGTHKLDLGDGYLIHGTYEGDSVGRPVSHGCIRMHNKDIARLYRLVGKGSAVFIF